MFSAAKVIQNTNSSKQSGPCQNELSDVLFSFMRSTSFKGKDKKEIFVR